MRNVIILLRPWPRTNPEIQHSGSNVQVLTSFPKRPCSLDCHLSSTGAKFPQPGGKSTCRIGRAPDPAIRNHGSAPPPPFYMKQSTSGKWDIKSLQRIREKNAPGLWAKVPHKAPCRNIPLLVPWNLGVAQSLQSTQCVTPTSFRVYVTFANIHHLFTALSMCVCVCVRTKVMIPIMLNYEAQQPYIPTTTANIEFIVRPYRGVAHKNCLLYCTITPLHDARRVVAHAPRVTVRERWHFGPNLLCPRLHELLVL